MQELGRMSTAQFKEADKYPLCVILDNVRSMHNIGSCFRTCDAFRVENVPQGSVIRVTGIGGSLLHEQTATATTVDIGMQGSPKGFYIVTVQTPEGKLIPLKGVLR